MFRPPGGILYPDGPAATETGRSTPPENRKLLCSTHSGVTCHTPSRRRRCAATNRRERCKPTASNEVWSVDFVADQLADGRRFRALTVVDVFTRESLAIEVGQSLKGEDAVRVLSRIGLQRTVPK